MNKPELRLPPHIRRLADDETFSFACHPGVDCFTECCRELELALTPYDVLRLCRELDISSTEFFELYGLVESGPEDIFPSVYLGMVDDGRASCPFVSERGCRVYGGRPAPCRTYPLGRGAWQDANGASNAFFVLLQEEHCQGFAEVRSQSVSEWIADQGITDYYAANDILIPLLQHERIKQGFRPTPSQQQHYLNTLYHLEEFRCSEPDGMKLTDLELLALAVERLIEDFFGPVEKP